MTEPVQGLQVVYHCDKNVVEHIKTHLDKIQAALHQCANRPIRVQTINGATYDGYISDVQHGHLYLMTSQAGFDNRAFSPFFPQNYYYNNVILPLVLYELLVISLL
ncbi:acetyl-CoA acetyltransferase [Paenibacillus sp. GCM10012307]|uniref:Acetyl-CoA acetyltransferase n=1 Tax=Paenibacillus roseus TaxID=2798579 RepID=A0A934J6Q3_9BACL|nr:acetyl-CoA acetyltransferase [Paenibacillus roseus]MBJ6363915.1 acetyl-CoA acetyltransferase [Paenibacillus roseus]